MFLPPTTLFLLSFTHSFTDMMRTTVRLLRPYELWRGLLRRYSSLVGFWWLSERLFCLRHLDWLPEIARLVLYMSPFFYCCNKDCFMCWTKTLWSGCKDGIKLECLVKKTLTLTCSAFDALGLWNILKFFFLLRPVHLLIWHFLYIFPCSVMSKAAIVCVFTYTTFVTGWPRS